MALDLGIGSSGSSSVGGIGATFANMVHGFFLRVLRWHNPFAMDTRGVGIARICLGLFTIWDLYLRCAKPGGLLWYTGSNYDEHAPVIWDDTPHHAPHHVVWFWRGPYWFNVLLTILHAVVGIFYTVGWFHPYAGWATWFLVTGIQGRCQFIVDGSDLYFKLLLFWSNFMPLDACFVWRPTWLPQRVRHHLHTATSSSLASSSPTTTATATTTLKNRDGKTSTKLGGAVATARGTQFTSWATAAWVFQICVVYLGAIIARVYEGYAWFDGTAVYYASVQPFTSRAPMWLLRNFWITEYMTYSAMFGEGAIALLSLTSSIETPKIRLLQLAAVVGVHSGIAFLFYIPQFVVICLIAPLAMLPTAALDHVFGASSPPTPPSSSSPLLESPPLEQNSFSGIEVENGAEQADSQNLQADDLPRHSMRLRNRTVTMAAGVATTAVATTRASTAATGTDAGTGRGGTDHRGHRSSLSPLRPWGRFKTFMCSFFFFYMFYMTGHNDWSLYELPDEGNIGLSIRFLQSWAMFKNPSGYKIEKWLEAVVTVGDPESCGRGAGAGAGGVVDISNTCLSYDVLAGVTNGDWSPLDDERRAALKKKPTWPSLIYPGWRFERYTTYINNEPKPGAEPVLKQFSKFLCLMARQGLQADSQPHTMPMRMDAVWHTYLPTHPPPPAGIEPVYTILQDWTNTSIICPPAAAAAA